jgi:chemotaxis protein MotB
LRIAGLSVLSLAAVALTGCVSTEQYNAMKLSRDEAVSQLGQAQQQASTSSAQNEVLKRQLEMIRNSMDQEHALGGSQSATITDLQRQLQDSEARYREAVAMAAKAGSTPLPAVLTNELTALAEQNPNLVDFDSARGLIKFKSDVTFSPGSDVVTDAAKPVIDRFAQILNGPVASQYDLMVVGHTDSQPVSNPNTIRAGNRDNWYLSAHRAITVSKELQKHNVSASRIEVAGYADQRPAAPNDTPENKAKNRRVEVLILPTTTSHSTAVAAEGSAGPAVTAADRSSKAAKPGFNKDATTDVPPPAPRVIGNK